MNKSEAGALGAAITNEIQKSKAQKLREVYNENPKLCDFCNGKISYEKRLTNKFCSQECSAKRNNLSRGRELHEHHFACEVCDKELSHNQQRHLTKFCSISCRNSVVSKIKSRTKSNNNDSKAISKKSNHSCIECGIETHSRKFCSSHCQWFNKYKENIFNGTASESTMKLYLTTRHGIRCLNPLCAWDFEKRPVSVDLEHIDGNGCNNSLKNLTLLCRNCHSLTPTYKGKNKGNGREDRRLQYHEDKKRILEFGLGTKNSGIDP